MWEKRYAQTEGRWLIEGELLMVVGQLGMPYYWVVLSAQPLQLQLSNSRHLTDLSLFLDF